MWARILVNEVSRQSTPIATSARCDMSPPPKAVDPERSYLQVRPLTSDDLGHHPTPDRGQAHPDVAVAAGDRQVPVRLGPAEVWQAVRGTRSQAAPDALISTDGKARKIGPDGGDDAVDPAARHRSAPTGQLERAAEPQPVTQRHERDLSLPPQDRPPRGPP